MSKKGTVVIVVVAVVGVIACAGLGLLRWGEAVYWLSGGERGWSLGASVYQALGWGAEAYQEDLTRAHSLVRGETEWTDQPEESREHLERGWGRGHRRFGRGFRYSHFGGGLGRLVLLTLLLGLGVVLYRRWREAKAAASPQPEQ